MCAAVTSVRPIVAFADPPSESSAPSDVLVSTCSDAEAGLSPVQEKADDVKSTEPVARPRTVATVEYEARAWPPVLPPEASCVPVAVQSRLQDDDAVHAEPAEKPGSTGKLMGLADAPGAATISAAKATKMAARRTSESFRQWVESPQVVVRSALPTNSYPACATARVQQPTG